MSDWLLVIVTQSCGFTFGWGTSIVGHPMHGAVRRAYGKALCLPLNFIYEPKIALKISSLKNNNNNNKTVRLRKLIVGHYVSKREMCYFWNEERQGHVSFSVTRGKRLMFIQSFTFHKHLYFLITSSFQSSEVHGAGDVMFITHMRQQSCGRAPGWQWKKSSRHPKLPTPRPLLSPVHKIRATDCDSCSFWDDLNKSHSTSGWVIFVVLINGLSQGL